MTRNLFDEDPEDDPKQKGEARSYELDLYLHSERPLAIRVSDDGNINNSVFLPRSQISFVVGQSRRAPFKAMVKVTMPEWLAKEKKFI